MWLLSILFGSIWVVASTTVAEKISGRLGGLIAGLPSTAVVGLLFIGLTQGTEAATTATVILPLSSGLYCFFFIAYLLLSKRGFTVAIIGSLVTWFIIALIASIVAPSSLLVSLLIWLILVVLCIAWVVKNISIETKKIPQKIKGGPMWFKALLSGFVIGGVVLISKTAGPSWGGIFATFPAITISTLLVTAKSGGLEFTRLIAKNILISITTTLGLFAILVYITFPILGPILGTISSYILLLLVSIPLYHLVFEKLKD